MDTKVKDLVASAISEIKNMSDSDTIIGTPIKIDGGITIIPISKVSYGFAAGGSDLPSKNEKELFGGGSGAGVTINPLAFIVVNGEDVKLLELGAGNSPTNTIVNAVPDLISKIQAMFSKDKDKDKDKDKGKGGSKEPINIADMPENPPAVDEPEIEKVDINTEGFDF